MIKSEHIYGGSDRLFLNTELGCTSACTYCYLPSEGFEIGLNRSQASFRISATTLVEGLMRDSRFKPGKNGTLLSIGCFSEAWDPRNRQETKRLIKILLDFGNPMQLATKRKIRVDDLREITACAAWNKQLSIYISSATISCWSDYEPRTVAPAIRFESFTSCRDVDVPVCLYIKPLIPKITINDWELYGALMYKYKIPGIVGERFVGEHLGAASPISKKLFIIHEDEELIMRKKLSKYGPVFSKSEDASIYLRNEK